MTPWLRTSSYKPFELMAESGGGGGHGWARTERLTAAGWSEISQRDLAMPLAGGRLAVYVETTGHDQLVLTNEAGDKVPLECSDQLRARPDGSGLVCVATKKHWLQGDEENTLSVTTIDLTGKTLSRLSLTLPANTVRRSFFPHFPGFLADGTPVLSMHLNAAVERFAPGQEKGCAAFALRPDGVALLRQIMTPLWPECYRASFWTDHESLEIRPGSEMTSSRD